MGRFGPDNFSTLQIKGHVLHRVRAHLKVPAWFLVWNALLTKKFGGTQIETNKRNLVRNVTAWIGFNRTTDSNKIEVIVLDDQKSRELRRIRTTGLAVYLYDCPIL